MALAITSPMHASAALWPLPHYVVNTAFTFTEYVGTDVTISAISMVIATMTCCGDRKHCHREMFELIDRVGFCSSKRSSKNSSYFQRLHCTLYLQQGGGNIEHR